MATDRLDIFAQFLTPTGVAPRQHKPIETTDIMLLMVAHGRGVAALPGWLVEESREKFDVAPLKLGLEGVAKQIFLGYREADANIDYLRAFVDLARAHRDAGSNDG